MRAERLRWMTAGRNSPMPGPLVELFDDAPVHWAATRAAPSAAKEQPHERHYLSDWPDRCDHGDSFISRPPLRERRMSDVRTYPDPAASGPIPTPGGPLSYIHWGPVIAGAVLAAAIWSVLMAFASAVGLMIASPSPTWRDTSVWLAILSGFWIIVVTVGAYALGGYLAGRVRSTWRAAADEVEFRDGAHGLLVWALGVVLSVALLWATAAAYSAANHATVSPRESAGAPGFLA